MHMLETRDKKGMICLHRRLSVEPWRTRDLNASHALIRREGIRGDVQGSFFLTLDWESRDKNSDNETRTFGHVLDIINEFRTASTYREKNKTYHDGHELLECLALSALPLTMSSELEDAVLSAFLLRRKRKGHGNGNKSWLYL